MVYKISRYKQQKRSSNKGGKTNDNETREYSTYYFYNQLSEQEQAFYDELNTVCLSYLTGMKDVTTGYTEYVPAHGLSYEDATKVGEIFYYSNPQYYFLFNRTTGLYRTVNGKKELYMGIGIEPPFHKGEDRKKATEAFEEVLVEWEAEIAKETTVVAKEKAAHDLIVLNADYDMNAVNHQSAYGIMVEKRAVCTGYANAFAMLMNGAGIETITVSSNTHAWNQVRVDGNWYSIDATADDPNYGGASKVQYRFFNRSDAMLSSLGGSTYSKLSLWDGITPACTKDSNATRYSIGTIPSAKGQLEAPVISVAEEKEGTFVTMTSSVPGAEIYYTLDGKTPAKGNSKAKKYTGGFYVQPGTKVQAVCIKEEYLDSDTTGYVVPEKPVATPTPVQQPDQPVIKVQPISSNYTLGEQPKALSVVVAPVNNGEVSYQWYKNNKLVPGATKSTYTPPITLGSAKYHCVITNTLQGNTKSVTSSAAVIRIDKRSISDMRTTYANRHVYTGNTISPKITVLDGKKVLVQNRDYKVKYSNHRNAGVAVATIEGMGNYTGTKKVTFAIVPTQVKGVSAKAQKNAATVKWKKVAGVSHYEVSYSTSKQGRYQVAGNYTTTTATIKKLSKKKTYFVKVRGYKVVKGKKVYGGYSTVVSVKVK